MSIEPSSEQYKRYINPGNIPDGHCASCAFNTHLLLMERIKPEYAEAFEPGSEKFKLFGDWFYKKFVTDRDNNVDLSVSIGSGNDTIEKFEQLVKEAILKKTAPNTAVIICVDYGTHWYNAYHTVNDDVIFIDSQNGKQFNAYSTTLPKDTNIDIIIPKEDVIREYFGTVLPEIKKGGKNMRKQKKRKTNKKKNRIKKTKKINQGLK